MITKFKIWGQKMYVFIRLAAIDGVDGVTVFKAATLVIAFPL